MSKHTAEYAQIVEGINYKSSGTLSKYLKELQIAGYISKDKCWNIKTGITTQKDKPSKNSALSKYRLSDNYLRFYYKYIAPKLDRIKNDQYYDINVVHLPGWSFMMGFQFENLVLRNRNIIFKKLNLRSDDIIADNPYFQRATKRQQGCQLDYLIQTRLNTLFVCEIKFSKNTIGSSVIGEVQEKIKKLVIPRGFSCIPILIHMSGITDELYDKGYFLQCIDFGEYLR